VVRHPPSARLPERLRRAAVPLRRLQRRLVRQPQCGVPGGIGEGQRHHPGLDGDLLIPGSDLDQPGATERAARGLGSRLALDDKDIRRALQRGNAADFGDTALYRKVFALAERSAGKPLPRAILPGITLESPKITRTLTTAWFAQRVAERWRRCMGK
jgi:hypothetical protein